MHNFDSFEKFHFEKIIFSSNIRLILYNVYIKETKKWQHQCKEIITQKRQTSFKHPVVGNVWVHFAIMG